MYKVVVNARALSRRITGVQRYASEILAVIGERCRIERPARPLSGIAGHLWEQFALSRKVGAGSVLWSPANTGPLLVSDQVLTIHDLSPLEHPEWFRASFAAWYRLIWPVLLRQVRKIIVPSAFVRQQVQRRFPAARVTLIPQGVDHKRFHPNAGAPLPELPKRYVLFVGSLEPRKNLFGLLRAWEAIEADHDDTWLVIAGVEGPVFPALDLRTVSSRVCFLGYIPDASLPALYANAELFVLPSLAEGFGLPALEAMACGTPLLVSDGGALPEVAENAALSFSLSNPQSLRDRLHTILRDPVLSAQLSEVGLARAACFSWAQTAELTWRELHAV